DPLVWSVDRSYCVSPPEEALLYRPYLRELIQALNEVRSAGVNVQSAFFNLPPRLIVEEAARQLTPRVAGRMLRKLRPRPPPPSAEGRSRPAAAEGRVERT